MVPYHGMVCLASTEAHSKACSSLHDVSKGTDEESSIFLVVTKQKESYQNILLHSATLTMAKQALTTIRKPSLVIFLFLNWISAVRGWRGARAPVATLPTRRTFLLHHELTSTDTDEEPARVGRLAVRPYHPTHSKPSSPKYTTRKISVESCLVTKQGLQEDYNHYRNIALSNTTDRAVSLWTSDCAEWLKKDLGYPVQPGDLGENVFITGNLAYDDLDEGRRIALGSLVVVEVTEPIIPCANLCKLPYINDESKLPHERIATCQTFLERLDQLPGLRGWYAKVLQEGELRISDEVKLLPVPV